MAEHWLPPPCLPWPFRQLHGDGRRLNREPVTFLRLAWRLPIDVSALGTRYSPCETLSSARGVDGLLPRLKNAGNPGLHPLGLELTPDHPNPGLDRSGVRPGRFDRDPDRGAVREARLDLPLSGVPQRAARIAADPSAHPRHTRITSLLARPLPRLLDRSLRGPAAGLRAQIQVIGRVVLNDLIWASPTFPGSDEAGDLTTGRILSEPLSEVKVGTHPRWSPTSQVPHSTAQRTQTGNQRNHTSKRADGGSSSSRDILRTLQKE